MHFDFSFPKSYEIQHIENVPENVHPQFFYPRGKPFWRKGPQFLITNKRRETWIDMVSEEAPGGLYGVYSCPNPDQVLIVAGGTSHLLDTLAFESPSVLDNITYNYINIVMPCVSEEIILMAGWLDIVCIGKNGLLWDSRFEYEITEMEISNGAFYVNGLSAGTEEPWQMKAKLEDGSILRD